MVVYLNTDYIVPLIIQDYAPPLVGAMTLVALCGAAVSTANSMLLTAGTTLYYDVYLSIFKKTKVDDKTFNKRLRMIILVMGLIAVISAIMPPWFLAMGFVYVYGGFGAAFFLVVFLGLYWKRMNAAGGYAGIISGLVTYVISDAMGDTNPFLITAVISLAGVLIAVFAAKKPPLEAYEPFFNADISESTKKAINRVRERDSSVEERNSKAKIS